ncbi:MAG: Omp28-related outer membrane protein [Ignavibacteriaceae bacterium]|nr:Omp28-related outer membrane protein [Ignavibacteriaceae bacterium]
MIYLQKILLITSFLFFHIHSNLFSQQQRNPVLEYCTGTWCQWCPCGHMVIEQIKSSIPNAIFLGYHGPAGSSDPWDGFQGNSIINLLTFSAYPTGVVDRTSAPISRDSWFNTVNNRNGILATVSITADGAFNPGNRLLNLNVNSTALQNLSGTFNMNLIILEDSLVYPQSGNSSCPGGNQYIHHNVVRAMINGAEGEILVNGSTWNIGETISKNIQYTVPANLLAEKCHLVVLVYKVQAPFYTAQVQQAEKFSLTNLFQISITVTSPNGGEFILAGSNSTITWTAENTDSVKIEYTTDSGVSWNQITVGCLNTGSFNWDVPNVSSNNCSIRIANLNNELNFDESDNSFTIYRVQFNVYSGWNLVSIPILSNNMSKSFLFPTAISPVYAYNNGYYTVDTLLNGESYWVKFNSNETISLHGNFIIENTINVSSGWNMIGPFDNTIDVNSIITQPPNLLASPFYGFGSGYYNANELEPGSGYWIKTNTSGIIQLNTATDFRERIPVK